MQESQGDKPQHLKGIITMPIFKLDPPLPTYGLLTAHPTVCCK